MARPRTKPQTPDWNGMPASDADKREIKAALMAVQVNLQEIESQRAAFTEVFEELHVKYGIPRRVFNFLAKSLFLGNQDQTFAKNEELEAAWNELEQVEID